MKVGDYVRSTDGLIAKIVNIEIKNGYDVLEFDNNICFLVDLIENKILKERRTRYLPLTEHIDVDKIKHSTNIIDLIEVGDYVNGCLIVEISEDPFIKGQINLWTNMIISEGKPFPNEYYKAKILEKDIKNVVTKEQFSSMQYNLK